MTIAALERHLAEWLGEWDPIDGRVTVVGSAKRTSPGWDGKIHDVIGVRTPEAAVLSVPPRAVDAVTDLVGAQPVGRALASLAGGLATAIGRPGTFGRGAFRWSDAPAPGADVGSWVPTDDERVPEWLRPFNGTVLIEWDDLGRYAGGVGRKQHDRFGHELSVGTEAHLRGRGIARLLVATAARRVLADGAIATYLHDHANTASARVAEASGFPDRGWEILGFW